MNIFDAFFKTCDDLEAAQSQLTEICADLNDVPPAGENGMLVDPPIVKEENEPMDIEETPQAKATAVPIDLPDGSVEDIGILTNVDIVPIIDDQHVVKLSAQPLAHQFSKGQRVRYTYELKNNCRKNIKILECNVPVKETRAPAEEDWDKARKGGDQAMAIAPEPIVITQSVPLATVKPTEATEPNGQVQWKGRVVNVRTNNIEVRFENDLVEVIQLTPEILAEGYQPAIDDTIVIECTTEPSDEDEEVEQLVSVLKVLPASEQSSCGAITELLEAYGVIGTDVYFTRIEEGYEVGKYLEFTAVTCEKDLFKWRCLSTKLTENPQLTLSNNEEYVTEANMQDREGLSIVNRHELKFRLATVGNYAEMTITFKNSSQRVFRFLNLFFYSERGRPQIRLKGATNPRPLNPNDELPIKINIKARFLCNYKEYAIAVFTGRGMSDELYMVCEIPIAIGSNNVIGSINNYERQYKARTMKVSADDKKSDGLQIYRLQRATPKFVDVRFERFHIPRPIWEYMVGDEREFEEKCRTEFPYLLESLSPFNYSERFHHMVHISEAYLRKCFRVHDMENVRFEKEGEYYCLKLENLAECRPSVLLEDTVVATGGGKQFNGMIKKILTDRVLFDFREEFHEAHQEARYSVSFHYSRSPFQKLHHAIDQMTKKYGDNFLFPDSVDVKEALLDVSYDCPEDEIEPAAINAPMLQRLANGQVKDVPWYNSDLNVYQRRAIINALRGECRPLPHLICGPPGTGKTSTLVELILQQFSMSSRSHILVCTPSNSAANLILEKLIKSETVLRDNFMRVIGYQVKERELIPEEFMPYCGTVEVSKEGTEGRQMSIAENGFREDCQMDYLCQLNIIVVTIGSVGAFMQMGFPDGHFSHLYVDEAGQCLETEILIPMSLLNKTSAHIVLVGDEKQLGPVVQFDPLQKWGYGLPLFERLQKFPMYDRANTEQYDQRLCYQLVNNYRSIPSILRIYNQLFYNSSLKPMIVDETNAEFECLRAVSSIFPPSSYRTRNSGVYFYSIKSTCSRTKFNPSWINAGECQSVMRFYKKLMDCGIAPMDVGIISPYQEQVRVIRSAIEAGGMEVPKIGSVEEFQGQERMIILMSTVRSKRRKEDKEFGLGFVGNAKRINVALSRARSLVVLFGNPLILGEDANWKMILLNCQKQMTYFEEEPRPRT